MFNMLHALTLSLRRNGGAYTSAPVIATVGDASYTAALAATPPPWLARNDVSLRFVPASVFERYSWYGNALQRFQHDFQSDVVLMLDADILVARPFDDLVESVAASQEFAGMIAHMCPFTDSGSAYWHRLYAHAGLEPPTLTHEHISWGAMAETQETRYCPPYFNLGVLCAPAALMARVGGTIFSSVDRVEELLGDAYLKCQIALTLSIAMDGLPCRYLPIVYNFPSGPVWEQFHSASLADAVFLHLYSANPNGFSKAQVYKDLNSVRELVERGKLTGTDEAARQILSDVMPQMVSDQKDVDDRIFASHSAA